MGSSIMIFEFVFPLSLLKMCQFMNRCVDVLLHWVCDNSIMLE